MRTLAAIALLAVAAPAVSQVKGHAEHPGWDAKREAKSLGMNIDTGIRTCNAQLMEATPEARATQRTLEAKGIRFGDEAPAYIKQFASGRFGPARYHRWFDPHAEIWLVAYTTTEACRVLVVNAPYAQASRPELERLITIDGFWAKDTNLSTDTGPSWSAVFQPAKPTQVAGYPLLKLQGTNSSNADGAGLQLAALVALARK